jgi:hypothetical protein
MTKYWHILDVQCMDGDTFYVQIPYGRSYELKKVREIYWGYDFIYLLLFMWVVKKKCVSLRAIIKLLTL